MTVPERTVSEDFLRLRQPPRRRRRQSPALTLVRILLRAFIVLAPPIGLATWLERSGSLELWELSAAGTERVALEWVESRLAPELGRNLLLLPLGRVHERLQGHPWIARIVVDKALPHGLRISIEERRAVAVLESGTSRVFVDEDGRRIAPVADGEPVDGYLRLRPADLTGGVPPAMALAETRCLRRAIELGRSLASAGAVLPRWTSHIEGIEVVGDDDFRIFFRSVPFPVLARSTDGVERARALGRLLPRIRERAETIGEIDLRFNSQVIVRSGDATHWEPTKET